MDSPATASPGTFCWVDLAAGDAGRAMSFYAQAFGWQFEPRRANGGHFTRCSVGGREVGSLYELRAAQLAHGVPSHWTPYLRVDDLDANTPRIAALGGRILVSPFEVDGVARIALIEDAVGAVLGLWEPLPPGRLGTIRP
ncbi:MAG: VOC family protein [Piscinibacter sp.]